MTVHMFKPHAAATEEVAAAAGPVEVLELIVEAVSTEHGTFPLYRVRNLDNGREAYAFGDELTTGETT